MLWYESQGEGISSAVCLRCMVSTASCSKGSSPAFCLFLSAPALVHPIITCVFHVPVSNHLDLALTMTVPSLVLCNHWRRVLMESSNQPPCAASLGVLRAWVGQGNPRGHSAVSAVGGGLFRNPHREDAQKCLCRSELFATF